MISQGLSYDGTSWVATYPWIKDPGLLPNNYNQALKMLEKTERRLNIDSSWRDVYSQQIQDMFNRDVARKLSDDEIEFYNGPIHYISHHAVAKPDSKTTPVRIVFNSSANYKGHVLNNYCAKRAGCLFKQFVRTSHTIP